MRLSPRTSVSLPSAKPRNQPALAQQPHRPTWAGRPLSQLASQPASLRSSTPFLQPSGLPVTACLLQVAGGALHGIGDPPSLVLHQEDLAKAPTGHLAPVALKVFLGEQGEAAQVLVHFPEQRSNPPPACLFSLLPLPSSWCWKGHPGRRDFLVLNRRGRGERGVCGSAACRRRACQRCCKISRQQQDRSHAQRTGVKCNVHLCTRQGLWVPLSRELLSGELRAIEGRRCPRQVPPPNLFCIPFSSLHCHKHKLGRIWFCSCLAKLHLDKGVSQGSPTCGLGGWPATRSHQACHVCSFVTAFAHV